MWALLGEVFSVKSKPSLYNEDQQQQHLRNIRGLILVVVRPTTVKVTDANLEWCSDMYICSKVT
jgi:hypothetical protein